MIFLLIKFWNMCFIKYTIVTLMHVDANLKLQSCCFLLSKYFLQDSSNKKPRNKRKMMYMID